MVLFDFASIFKGFWGWDLKSVFSFWKKDIINKLIILVSFTLVAGVSAFVYVIFNPLRAVMNQVLEGAHTPSGRT